MTASGSSGPGWKITSAGSPLLPARAGVFQLADELAAGSRIVRQ
jgi:hypothetical protein